MYFNWIKAILHTFPEWKVMHDRLEGLHAASTSLISRGIKAPPRSSQHSCLTLSEARPLHADDDTFFRLPPLVESLHRYREGIYAGAGCRASPVALEQVHARLVNWRHVGLHHLSLDIVEWIVVVADQIRNRMARTKERMLQGWFRLSWI